MDTVASSGLRTRARLAVGIAGILSSIALTAIPAFADVVAGTDSPAARVGEASWYGDEFGSRRTANGERFDPNGLTGAHRTLPMGSVVKVTNLRNGRSVMIRITDRGPFRHRREIDVSFSAARALGFVQSGVTRVLIEPM